MALNPFTKTSLHASLTAKAVELRGHEDAQAAAASSFIDAAHAARADSATAASHADAVERALAILDEAGVSL